ncbi:sensor histidine kinase [Azoarcus olearius]|uniref:histidine kinase n=1 Tax=Azoarcus sp. (strain BH72) TaxID=418699 RepID=A1K8B9_AZOSB|nr:sensor histidine kinase [Azoarcus olearius]CAL95074.1 putative sensory box histidine kinase [Azoarcus olearius]
MRLQSFLTRLMWASMLPLIVLAAWLALASLRETRENRDREAANLARNFMTAIDQTVRARIGALTVLAHSPLADDPAQRSALYREAEGLKHSFGGEVIQADLQMQMLFNTRVPYGSELPRLPRPRGRAAAPTAVETGQPAVGDLFVSPFSGNRVVAIAVPSMDNGRPRFVLLTVVEAAMFQQRIEQVSLPQGWALMLADSTGEPIAKVGEELEADEIAGGRSFEASSEYSGWRVVLDIPRREYHAPVIQAASLLLAVIVGAVVAGALGGRAASRRLSAEVETLARARNGQRPVLHIREFEAVARLLADSDAERRAVAVALEDSERRFRATFDQAAVGLALVSPEGHWQRVNQRLCDIVGYARDDLLQTSFQDITHPDDLDLDLAQMKQVLAGKISTYSMEKRYRRADGRLVWVNLTVSLVRDDDGAPDYFISVIEDIQRRKEAEAALLAREQTLREAQRLAGLGNWSWDLRTNQQVWADEIYRVYGRDPANGPLPYEEVSRQCSAESWERLNAAVERSLETGEGYECDVEFVREDGSHCWATVRGQPVRDANGVIVELKGTVQDITERMETAAALRELNASLEQRVEARTAELTAANKELDSFAYAVSHDLRSPLRAMSGFAQALLEDYGDRLDADGRGFLDQIILASRKMNDLIEGIMELSRSTGGELHRDDIDVSAMAGAILADLARVDPDRAVQVEVAPGLRTRGDARMVEAALRNLLGNAWKYTGKSPEPRIAVEYAEVDGLPGFCVVDNGAGFDMAYAEQLFKPFRRLHRQDEFPGIGIGLATVQRIVRRHGGEIRAEGHPGGGARFCLTLTPRDGRR